MNSRIERWASVGAVVVALSLAAAGPTLAEGDEFFRKPMPEDGLSADQVRAAFPELFGGGKGRNSTMAVPDIFGHGAVLDVGKLVMKVTNFGLFGNPFNTVSSDPSCQWPGQSSVEYMNFVALAVGAVNPQATDPNAIRRVSYGGLFEMRPATLNPEDKIYPAYDGVVNGVRFLNDDSDVLVTQTGTEQLIDEDFLDGHDNDGDGRIDEDFGAVGQKMFSLVMRDDTPESINFAQAEKHVPLGLEIRNRSWAYSLSQFENFNVVDYEILNVSGHELDSLVVGFRFDMDCGPTTDPSYFNDDFDLPFYPQGKFQYHLPDQDSRRQTLHSPSLYSVYPAGSPLCTDLNIQINGFSLSDDNGDEGKTTGVPSVLLFDMTTDPLGINAPSRVGWRAYRQFPSGTPYTQGGNPTIDQQRFEFMTSQQGIDLENPENITDKTNNYGLINAEQGDQKSDYSGWISVGPYLVVPNGGSVRVTIGMAVATGSYQLANRYPGEYRRYQAGLITQEALFEQFPSVENAFTAQVAFEGIWERRGGFHVTTFHGRESEICVPITGQTQFFADCRDGDNMRSIQAGQCAWFDFDCDYCSGVYDFGNGVGLFHKTWNASAPPPNPNTNVATNYNFTDNPNREFAPAGDGQVLIAWDNLSETSPDPSDSREFDFRTYKIWKVSGWTRPVGSPGPADDQWALLAEFRLFDFRNDRSHLPIPDNRYWKRISATESTLVCPRVWVPQKNDSMDICLKRGDLWDRQSGTILRPDTTIQCTGYPNCETEHGNAPGYSRAPLVIEETRTKYPVGRYRYVDREVKNGFLYFYAVTAADSSVSSSGVATELEGRRAAVEAEGVVPQISARALGAGGKVRVVPNPYKGFQDPTARPSSWDLTPNASDPTGTHVDFIGLPLGRWTIRIYTVSGDLVTELHSEDPVNESVRAEVSLPSGQVVPGYNRQQDTANDGQARWNLISRNGQDVVSGIYIFTVEAENGDVERGKFVVIR